MGIFNQSGAATTANQNVATVATSSVANFAALLRRGKLAVSEETEQMNRVERRKAFSKDILFNCVDGGIDTSLTAAYVMAKAADHDKRGRDYQVVICGNNWSAYCSLSSRVASLIETDADLKSMARPVGTKLDKCPDCLVQLVSAVGIDRIGDLTLAKYPIELTDDNPTYPERTDENGNAKGNVYFNDRLCFAEEVGEVMTDAEKLAHPAFIAWLGENTPTTFNANDAA